MLVKVGVLVGVLVAVLVGVAVSKAVVALALLLAGFRSLVVVTLAVFNNEAPVAFTLTRVRPQIVKTPPGLRVATVPVKAPLDKSRLACVPLTSLTCEVPLKLTPAGKRSLTMMFCAALGPVLVTIMVYVKTWPGATGFGALVLLMRKSALFGVGVGVSKFVVTLAVLLAGFASFVVVTLAVLTSELPVALALTKVWPVIVTTPPTFSVPTVPVNVLLARSRLGLMPFWAWMDEGPLNCTPLGNTSLIRTFCAVDGPAFVTTMV